MPSVKQQIRQVWLGLGATQSARVRHLLLEIIASILTGALVLFATHHGGKVYRELGRVLSQPVVISIVGLTATLAGYLAHWFKQKNLRIYGRVEMVFGTVSAFAIASAINPERPIIPQCVSLVGCAYVVARGLNNISEANARALRELLDTLRGMAEKVGEIASELATLKPPSQIPSDPA